MMRLLGQPFRLSSAFLKGIVVNIKASSIIFSLPTLVIAIVVSIATPSFAMLPMRDQGEAMQLQLRQLHDRLKLTGQQESLWQRAETASRDQMKSRRAGRRQAIGEMKETLNDPRADLRALSGKMEARREMAAKESGEIRELWLACYDSLDLKQRELVRRFLLERIEHMEEAMGRMKHDRHESDAPHEMEIPQ